MTNNIEDVVNNGFGSVIKLYADKTSDLLYFESFDEVENFKRDILIEVEEHPNRYDVIRINNSNGSENLYVNPNHKRKKQMGKIVTFFGGAVNDRTTKEYKESILIGEFLAENKRAIVNGGYGGLMEAVSKGGQNKGGFVAGVICESFTTYSKGNDYLTDTVSTNSIYERLEELIDEVDTFVVSKGGIGTLAELFLTWDIMRKTRNGKIYLIGEHWEGIIGALSAITSEKEKECLVFCKDYEDFKLKFK